MRVVFAIGIVSFALLQAAGCGDDGGGGGGSATLRGRITPGPSLRVVGGFQAVDTSSADAIWALPAGDARRALEQKIVLELGSDGSFEFTPDQQGVDYILALVDTSACTNTTPRNAWTEAQIDARTHCILGYVSIPDAESSGSMVLIPTSSMTENTNVGDVTPSTQASDEAGSAQTLQDIAPSFSVGLNGLQDLARVDNTLKALIWSYANTSDDGSQWYELHPNYDFFAPNSIEGASAAETSAADFLPLNWRLLWGTTVDASALQDDLFTPGYLEFIAPHAVDDFNGLRHYKQEEPMGTDFLPGQLEAGQFVGGSEPLSGAADGIWKIRREGDVVAKFDMQISAPFQSVDGVMDLSTITSYVPTLELEAEAGGDVTSVHVRLKTWDGTSYVSANAAQAFSRFELTGVALVGDGSAGCAGDNEFTTVWDSITDELLIWNPQGAWVTGAGSAGSCGLVGASFSYQLFGADYSFSWRQSVEPFAVTRRSSSYLAFDPAGGVEGSYVSFQVDSDAKAEEWRDVDMWIELGDIVTTPTAGLVKLGAGEDGVFHMRAQTDNHPSFYLEYAGVGAPPADLQTSATLTIHDGRPGRSKRSLSFPVSWSNTGIAAEAATLSVSSYQQIPQASVRHGGQREIQVDGSISGLAQGDHFSFSPASLADWPADEYELVSTRVLLLDGGTLNVATAPCIDAACAEFAANPGTSLGFYAAEAGDFDYQAFYTFRWTGVGSGPTLSSMVWNFGATLLHALASDNAAAPALPSTTPTSQMILSVTPTLVSISEGPLRVEYTAQISHNTTDGFFGDAISIDLPAGARVIPRTSTWLVTDFEDSLPEPTVVGTSYEWPFGTFVPVGSEATLKFEVLLAPSTGEQVATGQAWVGNTAVDLTATLGDSAPANATVTVNP